MYVGKVVKILHKFKLVHQIFVFKVMKDVCCSTKSLKAKITMTFMPILSVNKILNTTVFGSNKCKKLKITVTVSKGTVLKLLVLFDLQPKINDFILK